MNDDDPELILDLLMAALDERPARIGWSRPEMLYPMLIECGKALRGHGYSVSVGVTRGTAHLTARRIDGDT